MFQLSWRMVGERVAEDAAAAARDRLNVAEHKEPDALSSPPSSPSAIPTASTHPKQLLTLKGSSWFARRRQRGSSKDETDSASLKRLLLVSRPNSSKPLVRFPFLVFIISHLTFYKETTRAFY